MVYIKRAIEESVLKISNTFPVLLITGPRQVGKTTLLKRLADESRSYVSLDDPDVAAWREPKSAAARLFAWLTIYCRPIRTTGLYQHGLFECVI